MGDRRRELQRRRSGSGLLDGRREQPLLAIELGIDLSRQRPCFVVEPEQQRTPEGTGTHR